MWQAAHLLELSIYRLTPRLPREERYGLAARMRRAATSIAANIAEGFGRWTPKERARFYEVSRSSAEELRHYLILTKDLQFLARNEALDEQLNSVCRMLYRLRERVLSDCSSKRKNSLE